jgi:SSS family solute:Na+ symporter
MSVLASRGAEIGTVIVLFGLVAVLGFTAARWRRAPSPAGRWDLEDWGLGGRAFGGTITFFLVGGDLYTAYTLVAVPALVYAQGGLGFFAVSYVAITYPLVYVALPRLWSVAHVHGFVSTSEFVRARFGSPALSVLVAVAAIVGTMPYIALQIVGLQVVFQALGVGGALPLLLAFGFLAFFTFNSGLRAPALLAILKDFLLLITVLMLLLWFGVTQGGWAESLGIAGAKFAQRHGSSGGLLLAPAGQLGYVTLVLGSALALFLYPHAITGALAARNRATLKRSMSTLPVYSVMLGVFALFGFVALSAGIKPRGGNVDTIIPQMLHSALSGAALGLAYAALAIGALVPASVMSIGAANVFTRSIYREFIRPDATPGQEARVSRTASLLVKLGAIAVVLLLNLQFAVNLQLMGGVIILQLFPAVALGLFTNWFHRRALIAGLVAGLVSGILMLYQIPSVGAGGKITSAHFGGSSWPLAHLGLTTRLAVYAGLAALAVNLAVAAAGTLVCHWRGIARGVDLTDPSDYTADEDDRTVQRMPGLVEGQRSYRARHARLRDQRR